MERWYELTSSRERFNAAMVDLSSDDPPLWEEGIREDVWDAWNLDGTVLEADLRKRFRYDGREMAEVNLRPRPAVPEEVSEGHYLRLRDYFRPGEPERLPEEWTGQVTRWKSRDTALGMVFTRGFFQSLGVHDWRSLEPLMFAMADRPQEVSDGLAAAVEVSSWAIDIVTESADLDFAILSEPIASFHAPVISPDHYRRFVLPYYRRLVDRLRSAGVSVIVTQAFGQVDVLLPLWMDIGVNAFWCSHTVSAGMDYVKLRKEYGRDLRLIGGIDALALCREHADIDRAIERTVPVLLEDGGYLPLLDDRVRPEVPYGNYIHYRERLERTVA